MTQTPKRKPASPGSLSEVKFLMFMPRTMVDAVEQAAAALGQSRAGWLRQAAAERLERDQRRARRAAQ